MDIAGAALLNGEFRWEQSEMVTTRILVVPWRLALCGTMESGMLGGSNLFVRTITVSNVTVITVTSFGG